MQHVNIFKSIIIIAIVISLVFSFENYSNSSQDLDDLSYVMAIGIEKGETSKYKISLQLTTMESSATDAAIKSSEDSTGSEGSSSNGNSNASSTFIIHTSETDSIDSAINITNAYVNKAINLSHCKILVISEEVAKNGLDDLVNSIINKVEIRPDCNIIISQTPDNEFDDNTAPKLSTVLEKYYDIASNIDNGQGYSKSVKLSDFYFALNDSFTEPCATLGLISNTNSNTNTSNTKEKSNIDVQSRSLTSNPDNSAVELLGLAVFNKSNLIGTLSANQVLAHQMIRNDLKYCTLNMPSPFNSDDTLDLYVSPLKRSKINVNITKGSPFVEIDLYLTISILSFNSKTISTITEDNINIIRNYASEYIQNMVYDYLNKTAKEFNSDVAGIGKYASKNFKTIQDFENYNWLANYSNSTFKVNVDASVKSSHLLSNE